MSSGMPGSDSRTDTTGQPLAAVAGPDLRVTLRAALPLTLNDATCWRTDGNSPVRITSDGAVAFFSTYTPIGHTLRRRGRRDLVFDEPAVPITLRNDPDRSAAILGRIPAGRWGAPSDIGDAAVFLLAPASNYMHGAVIPVDGGWLAR